MKNRYSLRFSPNHRLKNHQLDPVAVVAANSYCSLIIAHRELLLLNSVCRRMQGPLFPTLVLFTDEAYLTMEDCYNSRLFTVVKPSPSLSLLVVDECLFFFVAA
ncbi:hypothetical protein AVEN_96093-1 [Araneus ventricosus]|uniref:Uncharacterized protein n=1 Tax=Araneus ventricosus TaxID=182803 RepID=A0A4Y2B3F7_ARAVE|nr:hypothetical protein AVEN_96093-1 [Araneus ventricosus]